MDLQHELHIRYASSGIIHVRTHATFNIQSDSTFSVPLTRLTLLCQIIISKTESMNSNEKFIDNDQM